jgi:phosphoribosyl-AMP cyclohydrolase
MPSLETLPRDVVEGLVRRLREAEPAAIGVLVTGSYAVGRATSQSDLDLTVLTAVPEVCHYRTWFVPCAGRLLHVSAGAVSLAAWIAEGDEVASWSLGFPTEEIAVWLWATEAARAVLGDVPTTRRPPATPELEDFLECATKVRRAAAAGDSPGLRWHAHHLGCYAPRLLLPLNPERRVRDVRDALQAALELPVAPPGYAGDLGVCLALRPAGDAEVAAAALRLARGLLAFLRAHRPEVDSQPELARYLADGTLQRHLEG